MLLEEGFDIEWTLQLLLEIYSGPGADDAPSAMQ